MVSTLALATLNLSHQETHKRPTGLNFQPFFASWQEQFDLRTHRQTRPATHAVAMTIVNYSITTLRWTYDVWHIHNDRVPKLNCTVYTVAKKPSTEYFQRHFCRNRRLFRSCGQVGRDRVNGGWCYTAVHYLRSSQLATPLFGPLVFCWFSALLPFYCKLSTPSTCVCDMM